MFAATGGALYCRCLEMLLVAMGSGVRGALMTPEAVYVSMSRACIHSSKINDANRQWKVIAPFSSRCAPRQGQFHLLHSTYLHSSVYPSSGHNNGYEVPVYSQWPTGQTSLGRSSKSNVSYELTAPMVITSRITDSEAVYTYRTFQTS